MSNQIVSSGVTIPGGTVASGDILTVNAGGAANAILVDGGQETLFGSGSGTTIEQGGALTVSGGTAFATTVSGGGDVLVASGGLASSTTVDGGGTFVVLSGGSARTLVVNSGGTALIDTGAAASDISVAAGGVLVLSSQPSRSVTGVGVASGGYVVVEPGAGDIGPQQGSVVASGIAVLQQGGGIATYATSVPDLTVSSAAIEYILPHGTAVGGTVAAGGIQQVFFGGVASGVVLSHSFQTLSSGASATATVVDQGAVEYVYSGGSATDTVVNSGGFALVDSGGSATKIVVNSGGIDAVDGAVSGTTVSSGGGEYVVFSGTATATTISNGGFAYVFGVANSTQIDQGAYEVVEGGGRAIGASVSSGGVLIAEPGTVTPLGAVSGAFIGGATISSGGLELLFAGTSDSGTTVESGGTFIALPGAKVTNSTSLSGADIVSTGLVLVSGASVTLYGTSVPVSLTISSGAADYVLSAGIESGTTIDNTGYSEVDADGTAIDTVIQGGGTLAIASGGIATGAITFGSAGGLLTIATSALSGAVVSDFIQNDTIDFGIFAGGSISPTVTLLAGNLLQVTEGSTSATVQLDPNQDYSSSTFKVAQKSDGAEVTVTAAARAPNPPTSGSVVPVDIPLYVLPYGDGYKIGIEVSLNGGASYNMYEFDTGGTGFYAAYSPTSWSSYSVINPAPVLMNYVSGNSYTAQVVSTVMTFPTTSGGTLTTGKTDIGLIAAAQNPGTFTTQNWNSDLTGSPATPPLQTQFYGDFGMAMGTENGIAAVLSQLSNGLSNGYIITVGDYPNGTNGQIGSVQVGLTQADIDSFTTIIPMQGANTLEPFPNSGMPTYTEALANGELVLRNSETHFSTPTSFIFDTGTPTMRIYEGTTITPDDLQPFLSSGKTIAATTTVTTTSPADSQTDSDWKLMFNAGTNSGQNEALTSTFSSDREGSVNTGLNAFFGYRIMFDLADGIMGFQALCFAAGTHIMTPRGEIQVSALRLGDEVLTVSGATQSIVWIGRRTIDCRRHEEPSKILPVRIQAHAFGLGLPRRDLFLSPDHALLLEGALIPVKYLINGSTVAQVQTLSVDYYHIELTRHDVILADGLPAETYLDTGGRAAFINGGQVVQAHAAFGPREPGGYLLWETAGYAPIIVSGPIVARVKQLLARRARQIHRRQQSRYSRVTFAP